MAVRGVVIFCWIYARFVRSSTGWKIFRGWSLLSPCFFPDPYLGVQSGPPLRLCSTTVEGGMSQFIPDTKVNSTHPPQPLYAALTEQVRLWRKKHTPIRCTWKNTPNSWPTPLSLRTQAANLPVVEAVVKEVKKNMLMTTADESNYGCHFGWKLSLYYPRFDIAQSSMRNTLRKQCWK
jgi:hypothetical protein